MGTENIPDQKNKQYLLEVKQAAKQRPGEGKRRGVINYHLQNKSLVLLNMASWIKEYVYFHKP